MQNNKGFKKLREKDGFYLCANINFPEICTDTEQYISRKYKTGVELR